MKDLIKNYSKLSPEKQKAVKALLKQKGIDIDELIILPRNNNENVVPVSFAQQRLWFLEQFEPGSPLYIIPMGVKIKGNLDVNALEKAVNMIIDRHEVLRTTFISENGNVKQVIHNLLTINVNKINIITEDDKERKLKELIYNESTKPFDLINGPLLRLTLIETAKDEYVLLLPIHHIISDNWSTGIFIKELLENYQSIVNGVQFEKPELAIQYADFAIWQQNRLQSESLKRQIDYWLEQLKNCNPVLDIITDKPRPAVQTYNGSFQLFEMDENLYTDIQRFAKENDVTLFMVLVAAFFVMLYKYTSQEDINIGTPIANRNRTEIENLIGFFINTLVLRSKIDENQTIKDYLQQIKKIALAAYENQDIPFETIVEKLNIERDMSRTALFQAMFVLNNAPMTKLEFKNLTFEPLDIDNGTTKFDLVMSITEMENKLKGKFEFNIDLFKPFTINALIESYVRILKEFISDNNKKIDDIELLTDSEIMEKGSVIINENIDVKPDTIVNLFETIVEENKSKIAVVCENESVTYEELNNKANTIAKALIDASAVKNEIVGVFLNRSIDYVASFLGILKAGCVYLPLDIDYPEERLKYILSDSHTKFVVTSENNKTKLPESINQISVERLSDTSQIAKDVFPSVNPDDAAYIIYTSGSTGKPKGTLVDHGKFIEHYFSVRENFGITSDDVILQFAAFNFDASIEQILVPLLTGAKIILRDNKIWTPKEFTEKIKSHKITVVNPPTIVWEELAKYWADKEVSAPNETVKLFIAGGDEMKTDFVKIWNDSKMSSVRLLNAYGPTETIITASTYEVKSNDNSNFRIPIGKPLRGRNFYVLDKNGKVLPKGFPGELCIGGITAKEYLFKPDLTTEKFVKDPFSKNKESKFYKTGDLVKINKDGNVEFLGRIDAQVKVRGFRIELGEIEHVIRELPEIEDVVVIAVGKGNNKILAAYIIENNRTDDEDLFAYLNKKLPDYMIPSAIVRVSKFPKLPSGKIDKKSLPPVENLRRKVKAEFVTPRTPLEESITKIVIDVLGIDKVGVFDNFFELGGHSMLAMQVISKINEEFNVEISIKSLFENPTIDGISKAVLETQLMEEDEDELEALLNEITDSADEENSDVFSNTNNLEEK